MTQKELGRFFVPRNGVDRRSGLSGPAPYLTEEGFVLVDRRENADRRNSQRSAPGAKAAQQVDLYLISKVA